MSIDKKEDGVFYKKIRMIIASLAFTIGIIISSIGGVMFLSSSAKLLFFEKPLYFTDYEEQCRFRLEEGPLKIKEIDRDEKKVISPEELRECVGKLEKQDKERYRNEKMKSLVDAFSFLIVGFILFLSFKRIVFPGKKER